MMQIIHISNLLFVGNFLLSKYFPHNNIIQYNQTANEKDKKKKKSIIPGGIRTRDLWIRSPARYPLRYGDIW